jgi:hypothetical protein
MARELLNEGDAETMCIFEKEFPEGIAKCRQRKPQKRHPK